MSRQQNYTRRLVLDRAVACALMLALVLVPGAPVQALWTQAQTPATPPPGAPPLPPEEIRQANLALEAELKRQAEGISGERIGTDGAAVSQPVELALIFTRNLWVATLRQRAVVLAEIKEMPRDEKLALIDEMRRAAPALHSAYVNIIAAEGPALDPYRGEKTRYENLIAEADRLAAAGNVQAATEARDRAARSPWAFYLDRRNTFFGLLEANGVNSLLGLYSDNYIFANDYLFQTFMTRRYSLDTATRQQEMIDDFDAFLDANIKRLGKLANDAEALDEFEDFLEFANPKYARIHQIARLISDQTGLTLPGQLVYPLSDVGQSFTLAEQFGDKVREILVTLIALGTMVIPVVGVVVNAGIGLIEVVYESGKYVIQWSAATEARQTAAVTGQSHVITEDEKTRARGGRVVLAVIQTGAALPLVGATAREGRAARGATAGAAAVDASPASMPWVQRGIQKARALGIPENQIESFLKMAVPHTPEGRLFAKTLAQVGELDDLIAGARAAGVTEAEITTMVNAALARKSLLAVAQDLPIDLLRATFNRRGTTIVVDVPYRGTSRIGSDIVDDVAGDAFMTMFKGTAPARTIRGDLVTVFNLRTKLNFMRQGVPQVWTASELSTLQHMMQRTDLSTMYAFISDEFTFLKLFDDELIDIGRRFIAADNRQAIANGRALFPPGSVAVTPMSTTPGAAGAVTQAGTPFDSLLSPTFLAAAAAASMTGIYVRPDPNVGTSMMGGDPFAPFSVASATPTAPTLGMNAGGPITSTDLERAAYDQARARFGAVANWNTVHLATGGVAVVSADSTRAVIAVAGEGDQSQQIIFEVRARRDRFVDVERRFKGVNLQWSEPTAAGLGLPASVAPPTPTNPANVLRDAVPDTPSDTPPRFSRADARDLGFPAASMTHVSAGNEWTRKGGKPLDTKLAWTLNNATGGRWPMTAFNGPSTATAMPAPLIQFEGGTTDGRTITVPGATSGTAAVAPGFSLVRSAGWPSRAALLESPATQGGAAARPPLTIYATSLGESAGEAFAMTFINEGETPITVDTDLVVLEPVSGRTAVDIDRAIAAHPTRAGRVSTTLLAYCLEHLKQPPRAGTVFRLANDAVQQRYAPFRHVLTAARELRDAGQLPVDGGDPSAYFHSIRQWAVWTREQNLNQSRFGDAFVAHTRRNAEAAGRQWTPAFEQAARRLVPGRWQAVQRVLQTADRLASPNQGGAR